MKPETVKRILDVYNNIEEDDPDISTERLLQMTADMAKVSYSNVVDALAIDVKAKEKK